MEATFKTSRSTRTKHSSRKRARESSPPSFASSFAPIVRSPLNKIESPPRPHSAVRRGFLSSLWIYSYSGTAGKSSLLPSQLPFRAMPQSVISAAKFHMLCPKKWNTSSFFTFSPHFFSKSPMPLTTAKISLIPKFIPIFGITIPKNILIFGIRPFSEQISRRAKPRQRR